MYNMYTYIICIHFCLHFSYTICNCNNGRATYNTINICDRVLMEPLYSALFECFPHIDQHCGHIILGIRSTRSRPPPPFCPVAY